MRVTFVCSEDESLGVGYLSSYLKKHGYETSLVFDPRQFSRAYAQSQALASFFDIKKENVEKVVAQEPDLVAFSALTANYQWALEMAKLIKQEIDVPIIFGGIHPTSLPELVLQNKQVDMVCRGEGEQALLELVNSLEKKKKNYKIKNIWFKKNNKVIKNPVRPLIQDLDSLPFPDKKMFYEQLSPYYRKNSLVTTSRGCPFKCPFCCNNIYHRLYLQKGKIFRQRSVNNVIEELNKMKQEFASEHIFFIDDLFAADIKWLKEFVPIYKKKIKLPFSCLSHPNFINQEVAELLKDAGCRLLMLGLQTGDEKFRRTVFKRYETNEVIKKTAKACCKVKLKFSIDHILNAPGDNDRIELASAKFYNQIRPDMIHCYGLLYFPGTEITKLARRKKILSSRAEKLVNEGKAALYVSAVLTSRGTNLQQYYRQYALLLSVIPLLPGWWVEKILENKTALKLFRIFPLSIIWLIKTILNFRCDMGVLPLIVVKNELFFTKRFIQIKLKGFLK